MSPFSISVQPTTGNYTLMAPTHNMVGADMFFITPLGDCIPISYKLAFPYTNNIAKYEALTIGLKIMAQW